MRVQRAAASLPGRGHEIDAGTLVDALRGAMHVAEELTHDAAGEEDAITASGIRSGR